MGRVQSHNVVRSKFFFNCLHSCQIADSTLSLTPHRGILCSVFGARQLNVDLSKWDVSKVATLSEIFAADICCLASTANPFSSDISKWDTSRVTDVTRAFYSTKWFNADLSKWDVSKVTTLSGSKFFLSCLRCCRIADTTSWHPVQRFNADQFNADLSKWNVFKVTTMYWSKFFLSCLRCCRIADTTSWHSVQRFMLPTIQCGSQQVGRVQRQNLERVSSF